jgi:hypothetical protein
MVRPFAADAVRPALARAHMLLFYPASLLRMLAAFLIALAVRPEISLPDRWTAKLQTSAPAYDELYHALVSALSLPFEIVAIVLAVLLGIAALIAFFLAIFRAPFMFFDLATRRRFGLREVWVENGWLAWQWFLFNLCAGLAIGAAEFVAHRFLPLDGQGTGPGHWMNPWGSGVLAGCFVLAQWIASDFLLPVLALEGGDVIDGIAQAWHRLIPFPREVAGYLALKALLSTLAALVGLMLWFVLGYLIFAPLGRWVSCWCCGPRRMGRSHTPWE